MLAVLILNQQIWVANIGDCRGVKGDYKFTSLDFN